jgi:hypothetical protein
MYVHNHAGAKHHSFSSSLKALVAAAASKAEKLGFKAMAASAA